MRYYIILLLFIIFKSAIGQEVESLAFDVKTYDFGDILEERGPVEYSFLFKNKNPKSVQIVSVNTSCGCTTPGWTQGSIASGKSGFVKARFDPTGRPGFFSKTLTVSTSADTKPIVLIIRGNVKSEKDEPLFGVAIGNLAFMKSSINVGLVYNNLEAKQIEFPVKNLGTKTINFEKVVSPDYIIVKSPPILKAGETATITISYDGRKRKAFGFYTDNIEMYTSDMPDPVKSFSVYATLEEYFAPSFRAEVESTPVLLFSWYSVELGSYKERNVIEKKLVFRNDGKKDLNIRFVQPNCDCITVTTEKETLKPGQESFIQVHMKYPGRIGTSQKALTVYSNDPKNPAQQITLISVWDN